MTEMDQVTRAVARARAAFDQYEFAGQEDVDRLCAHVAYACCEPGFAREIAELAFAETGLGRVESKVGKMGKLKLTWAQMKGVPTCGVIERDVEPGIVKYAKPVGVIGALIPVTNPELTPALKSLWALKTRNAIVLAPHPRAAKVNARVAERIRAVLRALSFPEDLVVALEQPSKEASQELMGRCDLVLATGGAPMVHAAYSSGTPTYGVGTGNAYSIVDETCDLGETAQKIRLSKTADNASGCSSDNGVLAYDGVYDELVSALQAEGGYLIPAGHPEKAALQATMWSGPQTLNPSVIAQTAHKIAGMAGIAAPEETQFLMVEEDGIGPEYPFSREKLSPVLTLYRWSRFEQAIEMVNEITRYCGAGHSCAIHSTDEGRIERLAERVRVARITVRQAHALSNSGAWTNGLKSTCTLGCGTWGGSIVSENVTFEHLLNVTRVSRAIDASEPSNEQLFGAEVIRAVDALTTRIPADRYA
ncbi:MAG: aldehyde dehydrogenase family protein [Spirochaetaceae bacterium]|nr:MAG: aldehyde dehydrogenase family protein [Spirochaetaceae bacterium]